jgi:hypothetical protein
MTADREPLTGSLDLSGAPYLSDSSKPYVPSQR